MSKWHGGKGSTRRPEDKKKFDSEWDRIFKKKVEPITKEDIGKYAHPAYTRYPHLKDLEEGRWNWYGEAEKGENNDD